MSGLAIRSVVITPVAVRNPPLLNAVGVHEPFALRAILELRTDAGLVGLAEAYGEDAMLARLRAVAERLPGLDPFDLHRLAALVEEALAGVAADTPTELVGAASADKAVATAYSPFEVACLDLQGKAVGRPVCDLLGGAVREAVPFSAYLFYRWAGHPVDPGYAPDDWGETATPEDVVRQARRLVETYGFRSLKLKGGVRPPAEEIDAILALRDAFGDHPLRLDPNANWTVETGIAVGRALDGVLEYLEDPVDGIPGMAQVARAVGMPLATNMCVTRFADLPPALEAGAVGIVLADHHYWGGLRATQRLAAVCATFGLALSMHSNTHLGISLAAMTHLAAAVPEIAYACDTHSPWQREDVVERGALRFVDGSVPVPRGPGLGVELDRDALARLHEQYERCGLRHRDDVAAMRVADPAWDGRRPRF